MKKLSIIILMWVAFLLPSHAVLKEANLDTTLFMLRTELTSYHLDFEKQNEYAKQQQQQITKELMTIMHKPTRTPSCSTRSATVTSST